jgi:small subunit ribosomal protein S17
MGSISAPETSVDDRGRRKVFSGVVVSDKMAKTRVIRVDRLVRHGFYEKVMKAKTKLVAHDEQNQSKEGDLVEITGTRPLSKTKRWRISRIIKAAAVIETRPGGAA